MELKTTDFPKLTRTPIREIVLGLSFDGGFKSDALQPFLESPELKVKLPICTPTIKRSVTVSGDPKVKTKSNNSFDGWILKNENPNDRVLQLRIGSLSFHLINKYISLDELISEFEEYWEGISENTNDLRATSIFVRYLNLIPIESGKSIQDYVYVYPNHKFAGLKLNNFTQVGFTLEGSDVNLVSTEGQIGEEYGVVLDYTIRLNVNSGDNPLFFKEYHKLRRLKDIVFFNAITELTIKSHQV